MAIFHSTTKVISRSKGRSSVAAAAYRSGERIKNERDGITHDYTRKGNCYYSEIMLPENAPASFADRATLWNAVEKAEKRKDAQTAREIELALPNELSRAEQVTLIQEYIRSNFVNRGMIADFSVHAGHEHNRSKEHEADSNIKTENPHAHILLTMREVSADGFGKKERDWNNKANVMEWRQKWAAVCNREFERRGVDERIDHRSYTEQGIDREPTVHLGTTAHRMEQRGHMTERGNINREIEARNMNLQKDIQELDKEIQALREQQQREQREQLPQQQQGGEQRGGVHNPDRADEEAAREQQRKDGLSRIEPSAAKEEAMTQEQKRATAQRPAVDPREGAELPQASAEQIAFRLKELKAEYIRLELQIQQRQNASSQLQGEARQYSGQREDLQERTDTIKEYSNRIEQLQQQRRQLGAFAGKEKRAIDEQIRHLAQSREQATKSLARDYSVKPEGAAAKAQELQHQAARAAEQARQLGVLAELQQRQQEIGEQYRQEAQAAALHPDAEKIKEQTKQAPQRGGSMAERMAAAKAESQLKNAAAERSTPTRGMER